MKLAPFVSKKVINKDVIALFHSLNMEVLYIKDEDLITDDRKIVDFLEKLEDNRKFIVSDTFDESKYLKQLEKELNENTFNFTTLKMFVTTKCNLDCKYCLIRKNIEKREYTDSSIDYETGKKILGFFSELTLSSKSSHRTLMLYGGEPLLNYENMKKIILEARSLEKEGKLNGDLEIVLETNGTLVNQEISEFLKKNKVFTIVSIDGTEKIHNYYRPTCDGKNSWDKTIEGYGILKDTGCTAVISSVFTDKFAENSEEAITNLFKQFSPYSIGLNLYHVLDGQAIENDDTINMVKEYVQSWEKSKDKGLYIEHIMRRIRPLVEKKIRVKDCGACGNRIVSDCEGKIGICEGFVGNKDYFKFRDNVDEIMKDETFIDWSKRTQLLIEECRGCIAQGVCGGGCAYNGIILKGDLYKPDPYICQASIELVNWALDTWYKESSISKELEQSKFAWLEEGERTLILGKTPLHPRIPLQSISMEREK